MPRPIAQLKKDNRTKKKKQADFLTHFADVASVSAACRKAKVPRRTIYEWLHVKDDVYADEEFYNEYLKACKVAVAALEDEAIRRAHEGTLKPIYQGGKKVGTVREYSDTLLIFLLKGLAPERYKDRVHNEHTGKDGAAIQQNVTHEVVFKDYADEED